MDVVKNRLDFVLMFDVKDGNPNGDPDAGNAPRSDSETGHGLVSDGCIKRKIRNYVSMSRGKTDGFELFVKERSVLNNTIEAVFTELKLPDEEEEKKLKPVARQKNADAVSARLCSKYFDIRTFGGVIATGRNKNGGQIRGPAQLTFSRSVDPVVPQEHTITRMAVTTEEEAVDQSGGNRMMGRKATVPYGLYVGHGFINPSFAAQTGFSEQDLTVFFEALAKMFELDRSAGRGLMSLQRLIAFKHESALGNASAHRLFELVNVKKRDGVKEPRTFSDYEVKVGNVPAGVQRLELDDTGKLFAP